MSFSRKEIPEWLKENSNTLPSSNFTVSKSVAGSSRKNSLPKLKSKVISKKEQFLPLNLIDKEKDSLLIHVWHSLVKFEKKDGTVLFICPMEYFAPSLESQEIPAELVPIFNDSNCEFIRGHLIAEIFDYRQLPDSDTINALPSQADRKKIAFKPTQNSIWADVLQIQSKAQVFSADDSLKLEADILRLHNRDLDLSVDFASNAVKRAIANVENSRIPKPLKCFKNSSELECEAAKREEMRNLLLLMDETRPKRGSLERNSLLNIVDNIRKRKVNKNGILTQGLETKRGKLTTGKKAANDLTPPGLKIFRTIRFEREDKDKIFTLVNFYECPNGKFKVILREGELLNTSIGGFTKEFEFESLSLVEDYASNFIEHYLIFNTLVLDTNGPKTTSQVEKQGTPNLNNNVKDQDNSNIAGVHGASDGTNALPIVAPVPESTNNTRSPSITLTQNNEIPRAQNITATPEMSPSQNPSLGVASSIGGQATPQNIADYQQARHLLMLQQHAQLQQQVASGKQVPLPTNLSQQQLQQYINASLIRPGGQPRPPFPGYNLTAYQQQQLQQQQHNMQQQQHTLQSLINSQQQQALRQQSMATQNLTAQQQILAQRKNAMEALRQQQQRQQQQHSNPNNQLEPNHNIIRQQQVQAQMRPPIPKTPMLSQLENQAMHALQNKQSLTPQQNQIIDTLLQMPQISNDQKSKIITMRAQSLANPPQQINRSQASNAPSVEPRTPNPQRSATPQHPHQTTPLQSTTPQPNYTPQPGTPQQMSGSQGAPTPQITPQGFASQSRLGTPQLLTPQQQQALSALQQQALNPQLMKNMMMLQQLPNPTPQQQQYLKALQDRHAMNLLNQQNFLAQYQRELKLKQQSATISPNIANPSAMSPLTRDARPQLTPQEQQTIRMNQLQLQQQQMLQAQNIQRQQQLQAQFQHQNNLINQGAPLRPFNRPMMQPQLINQLQQQGLLMNHMGQMTPQQRQQFIAMAHQVNAMRPQLNQDQPQEGAPQKSPSQVP